MNELDFSLFKPEQAIFQITQPVAFKLWDKAGEVWSEIKAKMPELKMNTAEPNKTIFQLGNSLEYSIEIDKCRVNQFNPKATFADFIEKTEYFVEMVTTKLDIDFYNRLGFRTIYFKEFKTKKAASDAMSKLKIFNLKFDNLFKIDGNVYYPKLTFRWEGKSIGARIEIRAEKRNLDFTPPQPDWHAIKAKHLEKHGVVFDVDYYTLEPVAAGQLNVSEWLKLSSKLIKKDAEKILGNE